MRIGVISDTHDNMRNVGKIVELLNAADVDRVVHTGDITKAKTLDVLARLEAPLVGVFGNNDLERDTLDAAARRHGFHLVDPPLRLLWHDRRIAVIHDPTEYAGVETGRDVLLHGHTHRHVAEHRAGTFVFNPGECAGHMHGYNAIGVLDLDRLEPELIRF